MTYDSKRDCFVCWDLWTKIHRERGVRDGRFAPQSVQEMIQRAEGPCSDIDLDCTQHIGDDDA